MDLALVDLFNDNIGCFCNSAGWGVFNNHPPINLHYMIFILA